MTTIDQQQLLESARDFTDRALTAYTQGDERVVLVHAAFAMEHLSKAYLYGLHPTLLLDLQRGSVDSLLHLVNLGAMARKASFPRTISSKEARNRVADLLPSLTVPKDQLDKLIEIRDGVVHVGYLGESSTKEILAAFLRYSDALYEEIGVSEKDRWGDHWELVGKLIVQSLDRVDQRVQMKIRRAERYFEYLKQEPDSLFIIKLSHLSDEQLSIMGEEGDYSLPCPACDETANVSGEHEFLPPLDKETLSDLTPYSEVWLRTLVYITALACPACKLTLENPDEIKAANIPSPQENWAQIVFRGAPNSERMYSYLKLKPVGSRQPPAPQQPGGIFARRLEED
ncbi:hypothetical protein [Actinomadura nitritigenes]|uniref:hypothetical protein n=1 Tax=Actinomadura nitritigenes TaxID=134602 RepID=UPI003D9141E3